MRKCILALTTLVTMVATGSAAELNEENKTLIRFYASVAAAAGGAEKCGMSEGVGYEALDKIAQALRCKSKAGYISSSEADTMMKVIAVYYDRGVNAEMTLETCELGEKLVSGLLNTEGCD